MKVFDFDPDQYRRRYEEQGWVHVRRGLTQEFLDEARRLVAASQADRPLGGRGIAGEKAQFVFDFPEAGHYDELFDVVARMCGLDRDRVTLSERHIKAYESDAEPHPTAHKDRFASQVSVGLSLEVPTGSHLVLYPEDDVWENPLLTTGLRDMLPPDRQPEVTLQGAHEEVIHDEPGDVIAFRGSAFWHLRRLSAGTVNVYLKFNEFGSDPLGEDPSTPRRRSDTLALLGRDDELSRAVPVLSRQFDSVAREYRREGWPERLVAHVWGQAQVPVSEEEFALLRAVDGRTPASALDGDAVRRLAQAGVLDLLSPERR